MTNKPLSGKTALVTGGARRIGRGIALALAQAGADVAVTFRNSRAEAEETVRDVETFGRRSMAIECDVRSEDSVRAAVAGTVSRFGRLDLVVNNAAVFESAPLDSLTLDQWNLAFETNTRGLARRCLICALSRAGSSTSARWGEFMPGPAMPTIAHPRQRFTRLRRPWPRLLRLKSA